MLWDTQPRDASYEMTEDERVRISSHIEKEFGIKMAEAKKPLLIGRLSKRLRTLKMASFGEYFDFIHTPKGHDEYRIFTDLVSTHETSFFRESTHFDFLINEALPALYRAGAGQDRDLNILSAACSTGEEVYSSACAVEEFAKINNIKRIRYRITGTDISLHVVQFAARGVYNQKAVAKLPVFAHKYFMRSKDPAKSIVRVVPEIRERTRFVEMNLLEKSYPFDVHFDVVFCRNVMIYFDRKTQEYVSSKLCEVLAPGGYLLVGHSETLLGFPLPITSIAPATYVKY
jgi:chemotaxis protein methyltransferase CheR